MTEPQDATTRTDLSDLVVRRKADLGLSYEKLAERCIHPETHEQVIKGSWLHRLATGQPVIPPVAHQLEGLAVGLDVALGLVREAAGSQFLGIDTIWSDDEEVRAMVHEYREMDAEDQAKVRALMQSWRKLKRD